MNADASIRTFRAPDARAALSAVKAALGGDAIILETREVKGGLFGKAQVEITAARPGADGKVATPSTNKGKAAAWARAAGRAADSTASAQERDPAADRQLQEEVASLRRLVEQMRRRIENDGAEGDVDFTGEALRAYRRLLQRGVEEFLARELVRDAEAEAQAGRGRAAELVAALDELIAKHLVPAPPPWRSGDGRRVMALVGPTGVGKTTAIAKIAARALLETSFKVALITVDTYRVGASDQLARYGRIMGLPTQVARDQAGLAQAVKRFGDADMILIDTAGRSDNDAMMAQADLVRSVPNVQLHLVMSAATGGRELGAVAKRYRGLIPDRLIFTKLDEADGPGSILSAAAVSPRPIACVADGQRVPEDIHPVTRPDLLRLVHGS